jgi:hypothetical protein
MTTVDGGAWCVEGVRSQKKNFGETTEVALDDI